MKTIKSIIIIIALIINSFVFSQNAPNEGTGGFDPILAPVPSYVPTNGLVGYWGFNGNANDESGNGNNGSVNGATLTTDRNGNANSAYSFDGVSNYISTNLNGVLSSNSRSISFWYNSSSNNIDETVFTDYGGNNCGEGFACTLFPQNKPGVDNTCSYINSNNATNINTWNFYTISYSSTNDTSITNCNLYVNGVLQSTTPSGTLFGINTTNVIKFVIGSARFFNSVQYFNGKIDDVAIYNRALTQSEISQLYNSNPIQTLCTKTIQPYNVNVGDAAHNGATYVWSISPATPSAVISGNGTNSITIDWTNTPNGTYTLQAIETNAAGCVSTAVSAAINLSGTPTAPVAPATQNFCTASTVANLAATGSNLQWYDVATGGTALASTTALVTGTTYYVAQTIGTCESTRTAVAVTINTATAPTAVAQTFCSGSTVANLVATGTAIQWYAAATGGTALASNTALVTGTTYYASQTIGTCESTRTAVAVSINDPQITASATTVCAGTAVNLTASTSLSGSAALSTNLQTGLVGYWAFNGNANDLSGNGNNGTVNGATLTSDRLGNNNNSYQFIQDNQNIDIGRNTTMARINSDFTISAWIKINQYTSNSYANTIISNRGTIDNTGSCFALVGTINNLNYGKLEYGIGGGGSAASVLSNNVIPLNSWTNVVVTYNYLGSNNNLVKLYINGVLDNSGVLPNTPGPVNQNNYIGDEPFDPANQNFTGNIDDLAVFNRVLSSQEIQQLYTPAPTYLWSTGETTATINPTPTATTTYWCDVTTNGVTCRKNVTITVNPKTTPTFTTVASSCSNAALVALPTTSNNGISGTWSPALNNTTTTTYTFTPTLGQCANTTTQTISITAAKVTSAISFVAPNYVTIGTQVWTNKNLDVTTYRDGTPIPQVTDPAAWTALTTGAWCYYNNDPANGAIYGKLYNWYAVAGIHDAASLTTPSLRKQLAPNGWHVPTDAEWTKLLTNFSNSGFTTNRGGWRSPNGSFTAINSIGVWWTSTESSTTHALKWYTTGSTAFRLSDAKTYGFSVRLVKD